MREFFIGSFEKLVGVIVVLLAVGTVIGALATMFSGQSGSFFAAIAVLIGGALYTIMVGGMLYLALGIYGNTKRTAEAVEKLSLK